MRTSAGRIRLIAASTAARKLGEGFSEALESENVDNPGSRIARDKDAARAKRNRIPMSLFFSPSHGIIKALSRPRTSCPVPPGFRLHRPLGDSLDGRSGVTPALETPRQ